MEINEIEGKK